MGCIAVTASGNSSYKNHKIIKKKRPLIFQAFLNNSKIFKELVFLTYNDPLQLLIGAGFTIS